MAKKKDVNWKKIKTEYITTDISQRKLADKYKVSYSTIRNRSKNEGWYDEKLRYGSSVVAKAIEKSAAKEAAMLVAEYEIACQFVELLGASLKDNTYQSTINYGKTVLTDSLDTKKILEAANALSKFMDIKRIIKGHQTAQEQQSHELAVRRLELEEKKAQKDSAEDKEIRVVIDKDVEEFLV